jgi:hypothetical protein
MPHLRLPRRHWIARYATGLLLLGALLGGCGTKEDPDEDSGNTGTLRIVNATTLTSAAGLLIDDAARESSIARDAASATYRVSAGSHTVALANSSGSALASTTPTVAAGSATTLVAWTGDNNVVKYLSLNDLEAAPASGRAKLLVFHAARDAGTLDVHLTPAAEALGDTPLLGNVSPGSGSSGYSTVNAGSHRLRLLKAGSVLASDVRLDTTVTLPDAGVAALVVTPSTGGVLAHALVLQPGKAVTALANAQARVRVVSALPTNLSVAGAINGTPLPLLGGSPAVSPYTLVPAGTSTPQVTVNGGTLTAASWTAAPGSDNTLFVWGTGSAAQFTVFSDDNRLPASPSASRIRLLHGLADIPTDLKLSVADAEVSRASQGGFSPVTQVAAGSDITVSVSHALTAASVYQLTGKTIDAGSVYSVLLLGDNRQTSGNGLITTVFKER